MELAALLIGSGIFVALLKINHQLGCIKNQLHTLGISSEDHEARLRTIERVIPTATFLKRDYGHGQS